MPQLNVRMDAEGMLEDVDPQKIVHITSAITVGVLERGMASGKPSVVVSFELPDGRVVAAETSLALFHACAKAFAARYGWADE